MSKILPILCTLFLLSCSSFSSDSAEFQNSMTIYNNGRFKIVLYQIKSSKEIFNFLPIIKAPDFFRPHLYDPRTYNFILMPKLKVFEFKEIVYRPSGSVLNSFKKQVITLDQLKKNIKEYTDKFGNDIPIEIYAGKNVTLSSLCRILKICQEMGVYKFSLKAMQPKWEGVYKIPIVPLPKKIPKDELGLNFKITKQSCLINGKLKRNINQFLAQYRENTPKPIITITYSDDATVQELLPIIVMCHEYKFNQVYLKMK